MLLTLLLYFNVIILYSNQKKIAKFLLFICGIIEALIFEIKSDLNYLLNLIFVLKNI